MINDIKLVILNGKNSYRAILEETKSYFNIILEQHAQNVPVVIDGNEGTAMKSETITKSNSNTNKLEQRFQWFFEVK